MLDGGLSGKMPPGWVCLDSGNRAPSAVPAPACNHFGLVMELPFAHLVCGDVILSRAWRRLDPDQANIGPRSPDRVSGGWMSTRLHMCLDLVLSTASRIILLGNLSGTAYTASLSYEWWISTFYSLRMTSRYATFLAISYVIPGIKSMLPAPSQLRSPYSQ